KTLPMPLPRRRLPMLIRANTTPTRYRLAGLRLCARCCRPRQWRSRMTTAAPEPKGNMGRPEPRIDGRDKVTGAARYPSDFAVSDPAYAFLVTSAIALGRISAIDLTEAQAVRGVLTILTHENTSGDVRKTEFF